MFSIKYPGECNSNLMCLLHPSSLGSPSAEPRMTITPNSTASNLPRNSVRSLLESCKNPKHLKQAHAHLLKRDPSCPHSHSLLLSSYALSPRPNLCYAKSLFSLLREPAVFHWNSLIRAFSASKRPEEAISLYAAMLRSGARPNNFTYPFVLKACSAYQSPRYGVSVHAHVIKVGLEADPYAQSAMICMYVDKKDIAAASRVFERCSEWESFSWNAMIDGHVKRGELERARDLFDRMRCRDVVSWNTMINGYALMGCLGEARMLFARMPHRNLVSWNSMLAGHAKCGDVEGARKIFEEMPQHDVLSWNTMLACYAQSGRSSEALVLFGEMKRAKIRPTDATIVSLLSACSHLGALDEGESLHAYINANKIDLNTILATALVDMYAKCGSISRAMQIFNAIEHKDVLAWNAIIGGLAMHGHVGEALQLFKEMNESSSAPDDITFVAVLSACSHAGMVEEGRCLLDCMKSTYGIDPKVEHYGCIIDLLARAGLLEDAMELTRAMPMEPNAPAWGALLGGCRIHGNIEVGKDVGENLLNLQPKHSGRYVLLSNLYAAVNQWEDARQVRSMMIANGVAKIPGMSMIELKGIVNQFVAGDRSHPESENIYMKLAEISERLKNEAGYSPDTKQVLLDIEEEEKVHALSVHSEKLAIALGLLQTSPEETIRVVKNLRVCRDCHHVTKLISRVYSREIIMRDRNRFHLFKDGACSCMDYW